MLTEERRRHTYRARLSSPEELTRYLAAEIAKYRKIIIEAGIKPQ